LFSKTSRLLTATANVIFLLGEAFIVWGIPDGCNSLYSARVKPGKRTAGGLLIMTRSAILRIATVSLGLPAPAS